MLPISNWISLILHIIFGASTLKYHFIRKAVVLHHLEAGISRKSFGGGSKYLTCWGFYGSLIYFAIAIINDANKCFGQTSQKLSTIGVFMKHLYPTIITLHTIICVLFWTLYSINPSLLAKPAAYEGIAWDLILYTHGYLCVIMYSLSMVYKHQMCKTVLPLNSNYCRCIVAIIMISYAIWSQICDYMNGRCSYSFLNDLSLVQYWVFYAFVAIFSVVLHEIILVCFMRRIYGKRPNNYKNV